MGDTVLTTATIMCFVASAKSDEAKKFYAGTLGLRFLEENEYSLIFSVNETLTLRVQKVAELTPQRPAVFGWEVADIEAAVTSLVERGVTFEVLGFPLQDARGICAFESGDKVAWFKDPDGNTLSLAQVGGD